MPPLTNKLVTTELLHVIKILLVKAIPEMAEGAREQLLLHTFDPSLFHSII